MESKSLLFGIIGFILGGLVVSIAATANPENSNSSPSQKGGYSMQMSSTDDLSKQSGEEFDKAFLEQMIEHHEGAIEMSKLASNRAEHNEIKLFSQNVISSQTKEVEMLTSLQKRWGYTTAEK